MGDFQSRWDVAKIISGFGPMAIAPLLKLLEDPEEDWELAWFVARILGEFQHPDAIAALVTLIKTSDHDDIIGVATSALAHIGPSALAPLIELLAFDTTRLPAVQALAQIQSPQATEGLLQAVRDQDPQVRAIAITALGHVSEPRVLPVLMEALQDPVARVRQAAVIGVRVHQSHAPSDTLVQGLEPLFGDLDLNVRRQVAIAFGRLGTPHAVAILGRELRSPHTPIPVGLEMVRALSRIESDDALQHLADYLQRDWDPSATVGESTYFTLCQEIFAVLGRVESPSAKLLASRILAQSLSRNEASVHPPHARQTIALSLGHLGQIDAIDPLIQLLADADGGVRLHAIASLKQLDAEQAHHRLQRLLEQPDLAADFRVGVAIALQEWPS